MSKKYYLYADPSNGILEMKSVKELKAELESDIALAREEWNQHFIDDSEYMLNEECFYNSLQSTVGAIACAVSAKMYRKIEEEYGIDN